MFKKSISVMILILAFITLSISPDLLAKEPISSRAPVFQNGLGYSGGSVLYSALVGSKRGIEFNPNYAKVHNVFWLASQQFGNYSKIAEMKLNDATVQNSPKEGKKNSIYQADRIAKEILAGGALSAVGGFGVMFLGIRVCKDESAEAETQCIIPIIPFIFAGSALGSASGVYFLGTTGGESGSFSAALFGSILGCAVGCGGYAIWLVEKRCGSNCYAIDEEFTIVTALTFLMHSIGGAIAFNLDKKLSARKSDAAIHIEDGEIQLTYPAFSIQRTQLPNHRPETTCALRLASVRF